MTYVIAVFPVVVVSRRKVPKKRIALKIQAFASQNGAQNQTIIQVAWQSAALLSISCKSIQPVLAWVEEPVSPAWSHSLHLQPLNSL